jgi:uncharacterized protein YggE
MRCRLPLPIYRAVCLLFLAAALSERSVAAEAPRGKITVNGTGTTEVKPDVAEVHTSVTANASLAADAVKKFRENRRRAFELLHKLAIQGLDIDGRGPMIASVSANNNQQGGAVMFNFNVNGVAGQAAAQPTGMNCSESLVIRVPRIDRLKDEEAINAVVQVVDACKDGGLVIETVQFKSTQLEANKATAIRSAVDAAREKAKLLAGLSHASVGPVLSIQETVATSGLENLAQTLSDSSGDSISMNGLNIQASSSTPLAKITVRAAVTVEFSLEKGN